MGLNLQSVSGIHIVIDEMPFKVLDDYELYRIISPVDLTDCCVKMFNGQNKREHFDAKIKYLCNNRPPAISNNENSIYCWPKDMVLHNHSIAGYIVPSIYDGSISLKELCEEKIKSKFDVLWHENFDRNKPTSLQNRIELCINLCKALKNIHDQKHLVLIDLNPKNIYVTIDGKVSLDSFDGMQIGSSAKILYYGYGTHSEYFPPEGKKLSPSKDQIDETWDRFSLSVILYKLLVGVHPFSIHNSGTYKHINTFAESIQSGLFIQGSRSEYFETENTSSNYSLLSDRIRQLFYQSFEMGHTNPNERPTVSDWINAFSGDEIVEMIQRFPLSFQEESPIHPENSKTELETVNKSANTENSKETGEFYISDQKTLKNNDELEYTADEVNTPINDLSEENIAVVLPNGTEREENNSLNPNTDPIKPDYSYEIEEKEESKPYLETRGLKKFISDNKYVFDNYVVFETFVKRLWERIDILRTDEYISIENIDAQIVATPRGMFPRLLGFTPKDFDFEINKIEVIKDGKAKTMEEADVFLSECFGMQYHKLLEKIS